MRNLRRSWLSREVALFGAYAGAAVAAVALPALAPGLAGPGGAAALAAPLLGVAGVVASAMLYVVPGRPSWDSPLTIVQFGLTAALAAALVAGEPGWAAAAAAGQLAATVANLVRLARDGGYESSGTVRLTLDWFRLLFGARVVAALAGVGLALSGETLGAALPLAAAEAVNRYLFYVTVVPLNMPGNFFRGRP